METQNVGSIGVRTEAPRAKIHYVLYARKSTESDEKQALSIESQVKEMLAIADRDELTVIDIRRESHSAKESGQRPVFKEVLEDVRRGRYNGILTWAPDRLSRNAGDLGSVVDLMDEAKLLEIRTYGQQFKNSPNEKFLLMILCSQAKLENDNKSVNVKRGLRTRCEMGLRPGAATVGYINERRSDRKCEVIIDPERAPIVKQLFEKVAYEKWSGRKLFHWLKFDLNFKTKSGNKGLALSNIYLILQNPFYYGVFEYPRKSGNFYKGKHEPIITRDEYERIQVLLGRKSTPRQKKHEIVYRGPMKCGECGAMITAEEKVKRQKNGNVHNYTYYHCTKRKDENCSQKSIEEKELEKQIAEELGKIEIPADFKEWALSRLKEQNSKEIEDREKIYGSQRRSYDASVRKIDNLIDMRANGEIDEDEFRNRKEALLSEKSKFQELLKDTDKRIDNWLEVAERGFNFAEKASTIFADIENPNTLEAKKEIFATLGSDLILKDKKLFISWDKLLFPIKSMALEVREIKERLEPAKKPIDTKDMGEIYSHNPRLLRTLNEIRTFFRENPNAEF